MAVSSQGLQYLIRPIVFREPNLLMDSTWHGHIPFAFWIVEALRPKVLVELGTYNGGSYCAFCQAVKELDLSTACYAVDTWEGDAQSGFYGEEVFKTLSDYHGPRYSAFSRLLRSTFDEALEHFPEGSIDLLHIDGFHTYEAIKHDFTGWLSKLSERAVVLLHDTNVRERDFGAWRFWREISQRYPAFDFLHHHGLGVLGVGRQLPEPVEWLINVPTRAPEQVSVIRDYFARLGGVVGDRWSSRQQAAFLAAREEYIQLLAGEVATRDEQIHLLTGEVVARDGKILALAGEIAGIYQSTSWKFSLPVRVVGRWLKRPQETWLGRTIKTCWGWIRHLRRRVQEKRDAKLIKQSGLFDASFYLEQNPEVAGAGGDPLTHFLRQGAAEGRDPNPLFHTSYYLERNADVAQAGANPLAHYLHHGAAEGRDPSSIFDTATYLELNPEVARSGVNPLSHYFSTMKTLGSQAEPRFAATPGAAAGQDPEPVVPAVQAPVLFSILVPTYNQAGYLKTALNSILFQTYPHWEAVVVNDGSTDETAAVLGEYEKLDQRFRVFHKDNGGTASALNEGLRHCRGDWVLWLSSDDFFEVRKLEVLHRWIRENPEARFFHTDYYLYDDPRKIRVPHAHPLAGQKMPGPPWQTLAFFRHNYINGVSVALHREVVASVGVFRPEYRYAHDVDYWLRASHRYAFHFIPECLSSSRIYPSQDSAVHADRCLLDVARAGVDFLNQNRLTQMFPGVDWQAAAQVKEVIQACLDLMDDSEGVLNRGGAAPVLLDRVQEWLSQEAGEMKATLEESFHQEIRNLSFPGNIPARVGRLSRLTNALSIPFTFRPYHFFEELVTEFWRLVGTGEHQRAVALADYLQFYEQSSLAGPVPRLDHLYFYDIPIFINNRDQLANLKKLVDWLRQAGYRCLYILDNDSSYPPLLDYYGEIEPAVRVIRLQSNLGPYALWQGKILDYLHIATPFVLTDPDILPMEDCPPNVVEHFYQILARNPSINKVGFSLKIDDLPDHYRHKEAVQHWESQFWKDQCEDGNYRGLIDTTFALYRAGSHFTVEAIRTAPPYLARHLPWYVDSDHPDEEMQYYLANAGFGINNWSTERLPPAIEAWVAKHQKLAS